MWCECWWDLELLAALAVLILLVKEIFAVGAFTGDRFASGRIFLLVQGVAGLLAFFVPGIPALALLYLISAREMVSGIPQVMLAAGVREETRGE